MQKESLLSITLYSPPLWLSVILNYELQMTPYEMGITGKVTVYLKPKVNQLSGIAVKGSNKQHLQNISEFREAFFGNDWWGKKAIIKNDSVLYFIRLTDTIVRKATMHDYELKEKQKNLDENGIWLNDSTVSIYLKYFTVKTTSPLLIELPLLGYRVFLDIVNFNTETHKYWRDYKYWGYNHFTAYTPKHQSEQKKYDTNRENAYYNSANHFCRALFNDKLSENGYLISIKGENTSAIPSEQQFISINSLIDRSTPGIARIVGLKNKQLNIYYFCRFNGHPFDVSKILHDYKAMTKALVDLDKENNSSLLFKSDTCIIRANGSSPNNDLLFEGKIASKRGGTLLPYDYLPEED